MQKQNRYIAFAVALIGIMFLVYLLAFYGAVDKEGRTFVILADLFPVVAALFGVTAISGHLRRLEKGEKLKKFWILVDLSLALWLVAETTWFVYEGVLGRTVPYPSVADFFWLIGYLPLIAAITGLLIGYKKLGLRFNWRRSAWVIPLVAAIIAIVIIFVGSPIVTSSEATTADKIINPTYAFLDLLILVPALVFALTLGGGSVGRPSVFISLALIALAVGDIAYISLTWNGLYSSGNFIDMFWVAGYLLFGIAAVHFTGMRESRARESALPAPGL